MQIWDGMREFSIFLNYPLNKGPKENTFCAASCSSLCAINLCLAPRELSFIPELVTGGAGLGSTEEPSLSLFLFFFSGIRSGALANSATPDKHKCYIIIRVHGLLPRY